MDIQVAQGALGPHQSSPAGDSYSSTAAYLPTLITRYPSLAGYVAVVASTCLLAATLAVVDIFAGGEQRFVRVINTVAVHSVPQVGEGTRSILAQQDSVTAAGRSTTRREEEDEVEVRTSRTNRVYKAREGIDNANRKSERDAERERERERETDSYPGREPLRDENGARQPHTHNDKQQSITTIATTLHHSINK